MCPGGSQQMQAKMASAFCQSSATTTAMAATASSSASSKNNHNHHNHNFCPVNDEEQENCRHCGSHALHVDWAQGDKVCTDCGVVSEQQIRETRPEWREFGEAEDLAKGGPSVARSGLVPVDESRYLGGLQPTILSKTPFGGTTSSDSKLTMMRKKLFSTNRKLDRMMGHRHAHALRNARVSRLVRKRQLLESGNITETDQSDLDSVVTAGDDDVRPELEQILIQEEEDVHRMQSALNADKWSLRRAILLHGHHESMDDHDASEAERDDLQKRLDSKLRKASADLYRAYQMLQASSQRLQLPDRVTHEATTMLCKYAARRDGFVVKGVSSRLTTKKANVSAVQLKQAADSLREHNKMKQIGSLCAALLLLTARKLGWPRPLTEVCGCVEQHTSTSTSSSSANSTFIKPKHCSRAMEEIKTSFPDYARSIAAGSGSISLVGANPTSENDPVATIHFVDHAVRKLQLPPVAEASIRALVWHVRQEQASSGQDSGTKLSTMCASLAYFMCQAGSVMQRLALQAQTQDQHNSHGNRNRFRKSKFSSKSDSECMAPPPPKRPRIITVVNDEKRAGQNNDSTNDNNDDNEPFDVFSHQVGSDLLEKKREYEMRRMWDTWASQTTWFRTLADVEQSSGVSGNVILNHYKANIYPQRQSLLEWLKEAVTAVDSSRAEKPAAVGSKSVSDSQTANILTETPLASTLLSHVAAAAPLLINPTKGNQENLTFDRSR